MSPACSKTTPWQALAASSLIVIAGLAAHAAWAADVRQPTARPAPPELSTSGNAYLIGGAVRPPGPIVGDFFAIGGRVTVDQPVSGDVLTAAGSVSIRSAVGDDLRAAAADVDIQSTVAGEVHAVGANVLLSRTAVVAKDATLAGATVTVDGTVDGRLWIYAKKAVLNGRVAGDVRIVAEQIGIGPQANVGGSLSYDAEDFTRSDNAIIAGPLVREAEPPAAAAATPTPSRTGGGSVSSWFAGIVTYLGFLGCALILMLLFPRFATAVPATLRSRPARSLLWGFGVLLGAPLAMLLLVVTLLGIPIAIALLAVYPALAMLGYLAGVLCVAQRAQTFFRAGAGPLSPLATVGFLAASLLALMAAGQLPIIGAVVTLGLVASGLGACFLTWYERRSGEATPDQRPDATSTPALAGA